jgi:hypothetical protein
MSYVLIYNNPERNYIIGFSFASRYAALEKLRECVARGMLDSHFQIVKDTDPQAIWLANNKHIF